MHLWKASLLGTLNPLLTFKGQGLLLVFEHEEGVGGGVLNNEVAEPKASIAVQASTTRLPLATPTQKLRAKPPSPRASLVKVRHLD